MSVLHKYLSHSIRKCTFRHVCAGKIPSCRQWVLIRMQGCAGWFESSMSEGMFFHFRAHFNVHLITSSPDNRATQCFHFAIVVNLLDWTWGTGNTWEIFRHFTSVTSCFLSSALSSESGCSKRKEFAFKSKSLFRRDKKEKKMTKLPVLKMYPFPSVGIGNTSVVPIVS